MGDIDDADSSTKVVSSKIVEYEEFVEKTLKRELQRALDAYRADAEVLSQCRELRENIDLLIREKMGELETTVELGCGIYSKAVVPDTSRLFVSVGLGFQLEMPLVEAQEFITHKETVVVG